MRTRIAVIGEYCDTFRPHSALNESLNSFQKKYDFEYEWIDTIAVETRRDSLLENFSGIWSAPGSPFKSLEGALYAISYARLNDIPHLGTCAGFQHAIIEIARNILGVEDAQHEEYSPGSSNLFVNKLVCSLAGQTMDVVLKKGSLAHNLYGTHKTQENYYCNFGINPGFRNLLNHPSILISGVDQDNEIRLVELTNLRFFIISLFVPQTKSTPKSPHPLIKGFIQTVCSGKPYT